MLVLLALRGGEIPLKDAAAFLLRNGSFHPPVPSLGKKYLLGSVPCIDILHSQPFGKRSPISFSFSFFFFEAPFLRQLSGLQGGRRLLVS